MRAALARARTVGLSALWTPLHTRVTHIPARPSQLYFGRALSTSTALNDTQGRDNNDTAPKDAEPAALRKMADAAEAAREERIAMILQQMFGAGAQGSPVVRDARAPTPIIKPSESVCAPVPPPPDAATLPRKLASLNFDNTFVRQLPGDGTAENYVRQVRGVCYSRVDTASLKDAHLIHANPEAAALIDLDPAEFGNPDFAQYFSGNKALPGGAMWAHTYAGHQFGSWAGQLGDGRAISLGEVVNGRGERWELQLKGAGKTPYSRFADGRAVLRSSIREYLCSEAMYALGIPTSRALSIVGGSDTVVREELETAAVVCRMAPSWVRFGSFEHHYAFKKHEALKLLADYVIRHHFHGACDAESGAVTWTLPDPVLPAPAQDAGERKPLESPYSKLVREVAVRTARLMAHWQAVGFVHGVMNTDNFSILSLTIDYGPFGFIDAFDPDAVINHSDETGHYAYQRQPGIGAWNIERLATALTPLVGDDEELNSAISVYWQAFHPFYLGLMRAKLGVRGEHADDTDLVKSALAMLATHRVDYTLFFRLLSDVPAEQSADGDFALGMAPPETPSAEPAHAPPRGACGMPRGHVLRETACDESASGAGAASEPVAVPRSVSQLFPDTDAAREDLSSWLARYRVRLALEGVAHSERKARMDAVNPRYVLRNWMADKVIRDARAGDKTAVAQMHALLSRPFEANAEADALGYASPAPTWARGIAVSCSS
eukprot:Opistho-1_new@108424